MALNPIGINFLTPATTTTTWNQAAVNLAKHDDSSSAIVKEKLMKNNGIMSNPAGSIKNEELGQYYTDIKSEPHYAFSVKSDPRKVQEAMKVTNSFKTTSFDQFENRGNIEDKLTNKFRFNNVTKKYVEKLSATMTCLKVKAPKIDHYSLTASLNTCRQSPRYKEITVNTFLSPGKNLNVS